MKGRNDLIPVREQKAYLLHIEAATSMARETAIYGFLEFEVKRARLEKFFEEREQ